MSKMVHFTTPNSYSVCGSTGSMRVKRTTDEHAVTCSKCRKFIEKRNAETAKQKN